MRERSLPNQAIHWLLLTESGDSPYVNEMFYYDELHQYLQDGSYSQRLTKLPYASENNKRTWRGLWRVISPLITETLEGWIKAVEKLKGTAVGQAINHCTDKEVPRWRVVCTTLHMQLFLSQLCNLVHGYSSRSCCWVQCHKCHNVTRLQLRVGTVCQEEA